MLNFQFKFLVLTIEHIRAKAQWEFLEAFTNPSLKAGVKNNAGIINLGL
jgi:hypothetical protein